MFCTKSLRVVISNSTLAIARVKSSEQIGFIQICISLRKLEMYRAMHQSYKIDNIWQFQLKETQPIPRYRTQVNA